METFIFVASTQLVPNVAIIDCANLAMLNIMMIIE